MYLLQTLKYTLKYVCNMCIYTKKYIYIWKIYVYCIYAVVLRFEIYNDETKKAIEMRLNHIYKKGETVI